MTWPFAILLVIAYLALTLRIAFWLGGLLRDAEVFLRPEELEPVSCSCRRHGFPSPTCPLHGRSTA